MAAWNCPTSPGELGSERTTPVKAIVVYAAPSEMGKPICRASSHMPNPLTLQYTSECAMKRLKLRLSASAWNPEMSARSLSATLSASVCTPGCLRWLLSEKVCSSEMRSAKAIVCSVQTRASARKVASETKPTSDSQAATRSSRVNMVPAETRYETKNRIEIMSPSMM